MTVAAGVVTGSLVVWGGFSRGFKSNGLFNVVWLCPLERLVWSYKIGPNWEGVMKGPTAGTGVVRGEHTGTRIPSRGGPFTEELHRSVAPKVRSWSYVNRSLLRRFVSYTVYSLFWPKQSLITKKQKKTAFILCAEKHKPEQTTKTTLPKNWDTV